MDFAQFADIDSNVARSLFAQATIRRRRDQVEVNSPGWVVAYLLVKLDVQLTRLSPSAVICDGRAAAILAAASGWFPVLPVATAAGLAEVEPSTPGRASKQSSLCRAASLMEAGVETLRASAPSRSRLQHGPVLQRQLAAIQSDVARMRHDGNCTLVSPRRCNGGDAAGSHLTVASVTEVRVALVA